MGPAGGVAAGAVGTGMSAGFGAGLMGLVGGMVALGVSKFVGAVMEKIDQAESNAVDYDKLKRTLGDVGVSFGSLKTIVTSAADNLKITYTEAARLGTQFTKLANLSGRDHRTLGDELGVGVGLSRSFGLDPSQGVGVMGSMRGLGVTRDVQDSRKFALLIGETIGKSGAFAKADEVMGAIAGYAESQTRQSLGGANVSGYAGMFAGMVGSGIPGLDPSGAGALLARLNSSISGGGAMGEASQFFSGKIGARMGLDVFQQKVLREQGAFGTSDSAFSRDSVYGRYMGDQGPSGGQTNLSAQLAALKGDYGSDKGMLAMATANHLGVSTSQAMALHMIDPMQMGEMQRYGLKNMNGAGIGNLSKALYGNEGDRQYLKEQYLGRTGADALHGSDRMALEGAKTDPELKQALANIASKYDQERTQGSDIRDSKNLLDNLKVAMADKLVPYTQDIRAGVLFLAGKDKHMTGDDVQRDIERQESQSRAKNIQGRYGNDISAAEAAGAAKISGLRPGNMMAEPWWEEARKKKRSGDWSDADETAFQGRVSDHQARQRNGNSPEAMAEVRRIREATDEKVRGLRDEEKKALQAENTYLEQKLKAVDERASREKAMLDAERQANSPAAAAAIEASVAGRQGGASVGPGAKGYSSVPGAAGDAMKFFMDKGWSKEQAAGIVSNLVAESGLKPGASGDGGKAFGAAQWHPDRQADFRKWLGKDIEKSTLQEQYGFVHYEMTEGREQRAGRMLRGANGAGAAGAIVSRNYERPKFSDAEAAARASLAERLMGTQIPAGVTGGGPGTPGFNVTSDPVRVQLIDASGKPAAARTEIPTRVQAASPRGNTAGRFGASGDW
jgi:hypothetical protein